MKIVIFAVFLPVCLHRRPHTLTRDNNNNNNNYNWIANIIPREFKIEAEQSGYQLNHREPASCRAVVGLQR